MSVRGASGGVAGGGTLAAPSALAPAPGAGGSGRTRSTGGTAFGRSGEGAGEGRVGLAVPIGVGNARGSWGAAGVGALVGVRGGGGRSLRAALANEDQREAEERDGRRRGGRDHRRGEAVLTPSSAPAGA